MKHIKIITIALAVLSCSAVIAKAQEPQLNIRTQTVQFQAPDISARLHSVVVTKMDQLIKATYRHRGYVRIVELGTDGKEIAPEALNKKVVYDVEATRS